jgi:hypothetical protein
MAEQESLEFKIVMDDGPNTEVLARLAHLDLAGSAYRAAVLKYPNRNVYLRHGARIIERHDGEPPPPPLVHRDPNLKSWSAHLIGGRKMQLLGYIEAVSEATAIERAVVLFGIDGERRKRLAVNLRGYGSNLMPMFKDLSGQTFGYLFVLKRIENNKHNQTRYSVLCIRCREQRDVVTCSLTSGRTKSCGCLHSEVSADLTRRLTKHGYASGRKRTPEYHSLMSAIARIFNPNDTDYPAYGGRGLTMDDRYRRGETRLHNLRLARCYRDATAAAPRRPPNTDRTF